MQPLIPLLDRQAVSRRRLLPLRLRRLFGGDLVFPEPTGRPYVYANFVETLDGVVSYKIPHRSGGGEISGFSEHDRFAVGLLRAFADAKIIGSATFRDNPHPGHALLSIYPPMISEYRRLRSRLGKRTAEPLYVVVTGSGEVDLTDPRFHTEDFSVLIVTTDVGKAHLKRQWGAALGSVTVRSVGTGGHPEPGAILELLEKEFHVKLALHEGGPALFGSFLKTGLIDEMFLTIAPQIAGRSQVAPRPAIIEGVAWTPEEARRLQLISVKVGGDHLFLRLSFQNRLLGDRAARRSG